jgi:hypothetical protein
MIDEFKTVRIETILVSRVIHCTETGGSIHTRDFVNGRFVEIGSDVCPQMGLRFIKPYDSAQYPMNGPIYYFEGADDPNTDQESANYHFDRQTQADRVFTLIGNGGHTAMTDALGETGCTAAIFTAIASDPSGVEAAIRRCDWPVAITTRGRGR